MKSKFLFFFFLGAFALSQAARGNTSDATGAIDAFRAQGGTGHESGKEFYLKQAELIAVAVTGANLLTCGADPSKVGTIIYVGGSIAFLVNEIKSAADQTDYHRRKLAALELDDSKLAAPSGAVTIAQRDLQLQALESALSGEKNNKVFMERRKENVNTTVDVFTAAAVMIGLTELISFPFPPCLPITTAILYEELRKAYDVKDGEVDQSEASAGLSKSGFFKLIKEEIFKQSLITAAAYIDGIGRLIFVSIMTDKAKDIAQGLQERIDLATKNIAKLEAAISAWKAQTSTDPGSFGLVTGVTNSGVSTNFSGNSDYYAQNFSASLPQNNSCAGNSPQGVSFSADNCKKPLQLSPNLSTFNLGPLSGIASSALSYTDSVLRNDTAGASLSKTSLSSYAAKLKELNGSLFEDSNRELVKNGKSKVDFEALVKEKKLAISQASQEAASKTGFLNSSKIKKTDSEDLKRSSDSPHKPVLETAPDAIAITSSNDKFSVSGSVSDSPKSEPLTKDDVENILANYDRTKGQFKPKEEDSLFQVINKAYMRNLDRILLRKKKID